MSGNYHAMTAEDIANLVYWLGLRGKSAEISVAIALAESGGVPDKVNTDTNGTKDVGLWQINDVHTFEHNKSDGVIHDYQRSDPQANAYAMLQISKNGTKWSDWVTYNTGAYLPFMPAAIKAVKHTESVGGSNTQKPVTAGDPGAAIPQGVTGGAATALLDKTGFSSVADFLNALASPALWRLVGIGALGILIVVMGFALMLGSNKSIRSTAEKAALL